MAQRTIHYLFGELFSREIPLKDKNRFLLGSVLPDAFADAKERDKTHYIVRAIPGKRYFDFGRFREQFGEQMAQDDLYLGYYMHLVEDTFYRQFIYGRHELGDVVRGRDAFAVLHNDYHLLNAYIVNKYGIEYTITKPESIRSEPVCKIAGFAVDAFLEEMRLDFTEKPSGSTRFLTETMLGQFVEKYVPIGIKELRATLSGKTTLCPKDLTWERKTP